MSATSVAAGASVDLPTIPVGKLAPWALFTFLLAAIVVFFVSAILQLVLALAVGDADAAVDPLSKPEIRDAVARATFEQLIGFQLTQAQLQYNATR